jgi:hypothetical protein
MITGFSLLEINELESHYEIIFSESFKELLSLIGRKIIDISLKNTRNKDFLGNYKSLSIYDIQDEMIERFADHEIDKTYQNKFFMTAFLRQIDCEFIAYFIEANGTNNSPVYCWTMNTAFDTDSIEKYSDNIEQWLYKINPILYIELQARKIFCNVSTLG